MATFRRRRPRSGTLPACCWAASPNSSQSRNNSESHDSSQSHDRDRTFSQHRPRGERRAGARTRRRPQVAGRFPARRPGPHREPCRMRARRMRRLHGTARRHDRARLSHPAGPMRRRAGRHHRGRVRYGRDRRSAGGVPDPQCPAMRLLHARHAAHRPDAARARRRAEPRGDPRASVRQLLPLHRLSRHRGCGRGGGAGPRGRPPMKIVDDLPSGLSALDRPNSYIGRAVPRPNLARLTQGRGQYVSDVTLPRMAHVAFVRSPYAHARIKGIETAAARQQEGVIAVVTGPELAKVITPWVGVLTHLKGIKSGPQPAIAIERARWQGEAVCALVARSRAEAEDACELIEVAYEELAAVTDAETALEPGTPVIHSDLGDNL